MKACQPTVRTRLSSCHMLPDLRACDMFYHVCLQMQNVIGK